MCERKSVFLSLLFLSFSLLAFSQDGKPQALGGLPSELLAQPLPVFPVADLVVVQPSPTPTSEPLTLNERTARQLEAWIAYYGTVTDYVTRVQNWSETVLTSWEAVKVSSTNYEQATRAQIKARDEEIKDRDDTIKSLKGDCIKYVAIGVLTGFCAGLITGAVMAR